MKTTLTVLGIIMLLMQPTSHDMGHAWKKDSLQTYPLGSHNVELIHGDK